MISSNSSKAQVSVELLIIVGLILLIFVPIIVSVYFKSNESNSSVDSFKVELAVSRLANLVDSIGNLGEGAYINAEIYIPKNVKQIKFLSSQKGGEIVFVVDLNGVTNEYAQSVKYPVQGNPNPIISPKEGSAIFKITSINGVVNLQRV